MPDLSYIVFDHFIRGLLILPPLSVLQDPEAHDTISTMTAPEVGEATGRDDASTISASEVAQLETRRQPPGTINPSAEEAHINAGNLEVMKAHVSYLMLCHS